MHFNVKETEQGAAIRIPGQSMGQQAAELPSYLHGWRFLSLLVSDDEEAIAFKAWAAPEGPAIVVNPMFVSAEDLESPSKAILWLCASLTHISHLSILEAVLSQDGVGRFQSPAWAEFREVACRHTGMEWKEIVAAAKREGVDFMAEHLAACMFCESGIQQSLYDRVDGRSGLRLA